MKPKIIKPRGIKNPRPYQRIRASRDILVQCEVCGIKFKGKMCPNCSAKNKTIRGFWLENPYTPELRRE